MIIQITNSRGEREDVVMVIEKTEWLLSKY